MEHGKPISFSTLNYGSFTVPTSTALNDYRLSFMTSGRYDRNLINDMFAFYQIKAIGCVLEVKAGGNKHNWKHTQVWNTLLLRVWELNPEIIMHGDVRGLLLDSAVFPQDVADSGEAFITWMNSLMDKKNRSRRKWLVLKYSRKFTREIAAGIRLRGATSAVTLAANNAVSANTLINKAESCVGELVKQINKLEPKQRTRVAKLAIANVNQCIPVA